MSIRFDVWINCDRCGECVFCDGNISATHARRIAKAAGWRPSASHGDLCPGCFNKRNPYAQSDPPLLADELPGHLLSLPPQADSVRARAAAERQSALGDALPPDGWQADPDGWRR